MSNPRTCARAIHVIAGLAPGALPLRRPRQPARRGAPDLVAEETIHPHLAKPLFAAREDRRQLLLGRRLIEREPVVGRIQLRRLLRTPGADRLQLQPLPPRGLDPLRIAQAIPAHPHFVVALRQIRHQKPPLIVGDHGPTEERRQALRLGDDPHPGFRLAAVPNDAADAVGIHRHVLNPLRRLKFLRAAVPHRDPNQQHERQQSRSCHPADSTLSSRSRVHGALLDY